MLGMNILLGSTFVRHSGLLMSEKELNTSPLHIRFL